MISLYNEGVYLKNGNIVTSGEGLPAPKDARRGTMAYKIMSAHNKGSEDKMRIKFDALISHDITYVGIIQTARASGMEKFPLPYALTNCHNSLCAVGGTINEDDHVFGLSAAKKYGGIYVPANQSVIHMYAREALAGCGKMILGSDSHTRYGALGCMGVGEGGPELAKQLLNNTYDVDAPQVVLVNLVGKPKKGVGPHDVAIALVGTTFKNGFVKNKVLEFVGEGIKNLSADFRCAIDVMTTESTCLSSIWMTDDTIKKYYTVHGRPKAYYELKPDDIAYYDSMITIDLSKIESMIALPFHPSNAYTIKELNANALDILNAVQKEAVASFGPKVDFDIVSKYRDGHIWADQGIIAGGAGGLFENLCDAAQILRGGDVGCDYFSLSVYPGSVPVSMAITRNGIAADLLSSGAIIKPAFCGPCFGAGDVPANNGLSIRHSTRNFPNREGSKPAQGQISSVALMDARSIAATALNGGAITPATDIEPESANLEYEYDGSIYEKRVYNGWGKADPKAELKFGPNITDWPEMHALTDNLLLNLTAVIRDPVTTTDELIPSGETSSYRSNPLKLAEFALSRRVPEYVSLSKDIAKLEEERLSGQSPDRAVKALKKIGLSQDALKNTAIGSCVFAMKPGDGSAREQAASCQRVLGGMANICYEFATKRYRSNCINWGMMPFTLPENADFPCESGDFVYVEGIRDAIINKADKIPAKLITKNNVIEVDLSVGSLTDEEREILLAGCLMNWYKENNK